MGALFTHTRVDVNAVQNVEAILSSECTIL